MNRCGGLRRRRRRGTDFNHWSDRPLSPAAAADRKRYPNAKSRYLEPGRLERVKRVAGRVDALQGLAVGYRKWVEHERAKLAEFDGAAAVRAHRLGPSGVAYLEMVEADGRLDGTAAALGYLLSADRKRRAQGCPSVESQRHRLRKAVDALVDGDGSPMAMCRAAFAYVDGAGAGAGGTVARARDDRWLWAAELFLLAALATLPDDGGPDVATCLFAAGWFYAWTATGPEDLLESARLLADARRVTTGNGHRWTPQRWRLPDEVRDATGVRAVDGDDLWRAVCFVEHRVLRDAARSMTAQRALRAVEAACRLTERCGLDHWRRAPALFELGTMHEALGDPGGAARAFYECAAAAAAAVDNGSVEPPHATTRSEISLPVDADSFAVPDLDLEALLRAVLAGPEAPDDGVLQRITDDVLDRRNVRLTVKAVVARGRAAADRGQSNAARQHYAVARLLIEAYADHADSDDVEQARSTIPARRMTDGRTRLDAELIYDAIAVKRARTMIRRLRSPDSDAASLDPNDHSDRHEVDESTTSAKNQLGVQWRSTVRRLQTTVSGEYEYE